MTFWKTAALSAALLGAAGAGAVVAPVAHAQNPPARVTAPHAFEVLGGGGGRIGVSISDVEAGNTKVSTGVVVDSVEDDSPAATAGLKAGDVVVEFDGERVRSVRQFTRLVSETPAGRQVAAAVMRDGQRVSLNVTPREAGGSRLFDNGTWRSLERLRDFSVTVPPIPAPPSRPVPTPRAPRAPSAPRPPAFEGFMWSMGNQLGVTVSELSDQLGEYFGTKTGVLVASVADGSAAAKAGVKAGDVIVSINGEAVENGGDLRRETRRVDSGEEFTLTVVRDRKSVTLKGKMETNQNRHRTTTRTIL
jgi:C-terminal processing protease CtpA/Prc